MEVLFTGCTGDTEVKAHAWGMTKRRKHSLRGLLGTPVTHGRPSLVLQFMGSGARPGIGSPSIRGLFNLVGPFSQL